MIKSLKILGIFFLGICFTLLFLFWAFKNLQREARLDFENMAKEELATNKESIYHFPSFQFGSNYDLKDLELKLQHSGTDSICTINSKKGRLVIVNLWATWCIPCTTEFTFFDKLQADLKGKNIDFIFVSGENKEKVNSFKSESKYKLPFYTSDLKKVDSNSIFFSKTLPTTIIISPDQKFYLKSTGGALWYSEELKDFLIKLSAS